MHHKLLRSTVVAALIGLAFGCGAASVSLPKEDRATLPRDVAKMIAYVRATQIRQSSSPRSVGTWPSRAVTGLGGSQSRPESNIFMALQMSLALHRVAERFAVPGLDEIDAGVAAMLTAYLADVTATNEPQGSLAHWALYQTTDGHPIRYRDEPNGSYRTLRLFDIANDLDTSSQAYLWARYTGREADFRRDYLTMLGDWRDGEGRRLHRLEGAWKAPGSGAYLTWNERDQRDDPQSRIPGGVNDVDCVVNANVLMSLYDAERQQPLTAIQMQGRDATCALLLRAVAEDNIGRCAVYYDETHTIMALARALHTGAACLEPARAGLAAAASAAANALLQNADTPDVVDVMETSLALKWLHPADRPQTRAQVEPLIGDLDATFSSRVRTTTDDLAYTPEGALYHGTVYPAFGIPWTAYWRSQAASTVYAVEALTTP